MPAIHSVIRKIVKLSIKRVGNKREHFIDLVKSTFGEFYGTCPFLRVYEGMK